MTTFTKIIKNPKKAYRIKCPKCNAPVNNRCMRDSKNPYTYTDLPHKMRIAEYCATVIEKDLARKYKDNLTMDLLDSLERR